MRHDARPQPSRPAITPLPVYRVRMRNSPDKLRGAWAQFAKAARGRMSQAELARQLDVDRSTIYRWETGRARPDDPNVIQAFAEVTGISPAEAMAAAGLLPGIPIQKEPTRPPDELVDLVATDPKLSDRDKSEIIDLLLKRREQARQQLLEDAQWLIRSRHRPNGEAS
jgi:transcriptional regulator with XRE-family HTH domain